MIKPLQGFVILVVEDDSIQALSLGDLLLSSGAEVIGPAKTLQQALDLATNEDFNCAVLDVKLGDKCIDPVARLIDHRGKGIVFLTACDAKRVHEEFTQRNFALSSYKDSTGRELPAFEMTRDGFMRG